MIFYDDEFYEDVEEMLERLEIDEQELSTYPDDYQFKIYDTQLVPHVTLDNKDIIDMLLDKHPIPEGLEDYIEDGITKVINKYQNVFEQINKELPEIYEQTSEFEIYTKEDILNILKEQEL